ncbi:hypothetical protein HU200_002878 [Digitaria exilis]|uniref:AAA+ ATPase domain-containing protein n=1 Tax=Digitaria exilis TaxID=1010633 RepID=A0A835KTK8_9POAL|nr:hypothetical protein HU200_002878 [Digitaria exilis]
MPLFERAAREAAAAAAAMEEHSSSIIASAVGIGVGVGLGLASARFSAAGRSRGPTVGPTPAEVEAELRRLVVEGRDSGVTFDDFPYYISEEMRLALTTAAYPYLNQEALPKYINVHTDVSRTILLCSQSEYCLSSVVKAVAHQFNARLLELDVLELAKRIKHKYGCPENAGAVILGKSTTESTLGRLYGWIESFKCQSTKAEPTGSSRRERGILDLRTTDCRSKNASSVRVQVSLLPGAKDHDDSESTEEYETVHPSWNVDEKILMRSLYKVIVSVSECSPVILYIRDVDMVLQNSERTYSMFQKMLNKLSGRVLIIGSYLLTGDTDNYVDKDVSDLFPYILETKPPKEKAQYEKWKTQMETDAAKIKTDIFIKLITDVLSANKLECDDLSSLSLDEMGPIQTHLFDIIAPSVSYHLMNQKDPEYKNGKLIISSKSLSHGLRIFQESNLGKDTVVKTDEPKKVKDNEYEKRIRETVIPAGEIGVTFDDIGALDDIKESIQELVMLPLQRPDLFTGGLLKPCRGILLFGPPGTGKTMLAKAIADEAGASFINISFSSFASKWYGDAEKSIRALFSLAAKIAPAIIFLDEVDSMLGTRKQSNEHEVSRRIKTEFMTHWDGLLSKSSVKILVLAATNRPFDLDEAIIRRFEHRIMVGLPTLESRELILNKLLSKEKVENIDFKELARLTEGYSGSDLKNLCVTAAYRPMREILQKEIETKKDKDKQSQDKKEKQTQDKKEKQTQDKKDKQVAVKDEQAKSSQKGDKDAVKGEKSGKPSKQGTGKGKSEKGTKSDTEETIALRPLTMEDLKQAKEQVGPSLASEGIVMNEIKQWNELYGKGGSRKKEQLTYFL